LPKLKSVSVISVVLGSKHEIRKRAISHT
jgi:hypothetical protein